MESRSCRPSRVIGIVMAGLFSLLILPVKAQQDGLTGLESLKSLTGRDYKLLAEPSKPPGFRAGVSAGAFFPLSPGEDAFGHSINDSIARRIYSDPELYLRLMEQLGGEFFPGNQEGSTRIENIRLRPGAELRVAGGVSLADRFIVIAEYALHRHRMSGDLPVTVFPSKSGQPYTYYGHISTDITFHDVAVTGSCFFTRTRLRPFGGISVLWQWQKQAPVNVAFGEESFRLDNTDEVKSFPGMAVFSGAEYRLSGSFALSLKLQYQQIFSDKDGIKGSGFSTSFGCVWMFRL